MSGHSKWHNIQKTKGAADAKRSQIFTKIAREMIVAVKTGGSGDPNNNSRLATVIAKAHHRQGAGLGQQRRLREHHLRGVRPLRRGRDRGGPHG